MIKKQFSKTKAKRCTKRILALALTASMAASGIPGVQVNAANTTTSMDSVTKTYGTNLTLPKNTLTRPGYTFKNWNTKANGSGTSFADQGTVSTDLTETQGATVTLYAQWQAAPQSISYTLNGGTVSGSNPTSYTVETATFTLINPTKVGYTFAGWTGTGLSSATKTVSVAKGSLGNRAYTATYTPNTNTPYTVKHWQQKLGKNAATHDDVNYTLADTDNLTGTTDTSITPAVKSYTGFTAPSTQTTTISPDGSRVVNYYYTRNKYKVTASKGYGVASVSGGGDYEYGASVTIDATMKSGYTWAKWANTDGDKTTKQYTFTMPAKAVSYEAQGTLDEYSITYDGNGGVLATNPDKYTVESENITLANPTRVGYNFTGWTGSNGSEPEKPYTLAQGSTGNKSYKANWEARTDIPYVIKHWVQKIGGDAASKDSTNYTLKDKQDLEGTADAEITPAVKTYEGFTAPSAQTTTVLPDGSLVVNYYYTRNSYKFMLLVGRGIASVTDGSTTDAVKIEKDVEYGDDIAGSAALKPGYEWSTWSGSESIATQIWEKKMPASAFTVTAAATPITYDISYELDGGTNHTDNPSTFNVETETIILKAPSKTGYTFTGWTNDSIDGDEPKLNVTIDKGSINDKAFTAHWSENSYKVHFDGNKPATAVTTLTNNMSDQTFTYTESKALSDFDIELPGYTFTGWNSESNGSGTEYTDGKTVSKLSAENNDTVTLYAQWSLNTYNLTYDLDEGELNSGDSNPSTYTAETPTFTLKNPTKEGFAFRGWVENDGDTPNDSLEIEKGTVGHKAFKAKWREFGYIVHYEGNKPSNASTIVSGAVEDQTFAFTVRKALTDNAFALAGYDFKGWNTEADGSGTSYDDKQVVSRLSNQDGYVITLYAQWEARTDTKYTVKHYVQKLGANGAVHDSVNYDLHSEEELAGTSDTDVTPDVKSITGFTAPSTQTVNIDADGTRVVSYYYTRNKYAVNISGPHFATNVNDGGYEYDADVEITAVPAAGYTFDGWTGDKETEEATIEFKMGADAVNLTGNTTAIVYDITYTKNGGTTVDEPTSYTVEDTVDIPDATKRGYTFDGWDLGSSIPAGTIGNKHFTASFTANDYQVSFAGGDHGSTSEAAHTVTFDQQVGELPFPDEDPNWFFTGWYDSSDRLILPSTVVDWDEDITLTAKYSDVVYEVTLPDGTVISVPENRRVGDLPVPTKDGYTFDHYEDSDGNVVTSNTVITGPLELKAIFKPNKYEVTVGDEKLNIVFDTEVTGLPELTRERYEFLGWYAGDTKIQNGDKWTIASNTVLEDKWKFISDKKVNVKPGDKVLVAKEDTIPLIPEGNEYEIFKNTDPTVADVVEGNLVILKDGTTTIEILDNVTGLHAEYQIDVVDGIATIATIKHEYPSDLGISDTDPSYFDYTKEVVIDGTDIKVVENTDPSVADIEDGKLIFKKPNGTTEITVVIDGVQKVIKVTIEDGRAKVEVIDSKVTKLPSQVEATIAATKISLDNLKVVTNTNEDIIKVSDTEITFEGTGNGTLVLMELGTKTKKTFDVTVTDGKATLVLKKVEKVYTPSAPSSSSSSSSSSKPSIEPIQIPSNSKVISSSNPGVANVVGGEIVLTGQDGEAIIVIEVDGKQITYKIVVKNGKIEQMEKIEKDLTATEVASKVGDTVMVGIEDKLTIFPVSDGYTVLGNTNDSIAKVESGKLVFSGKEGNTDITISYNGVIYKYSVEVKGGYAYVTTKDILTVSSTPSESTYTFYTESIGDTLKIPSQAVVEVVEEGEQYSVISNTDNSIATVEDRAIKSTGKVGVASISIRNNTLRKTSKYQVDVGAEGASVALVAMQKDPEVEGADPDLSEPDNSSDSSSNESSDDLSDSSNSGISVRPAKGTNPYVAKKGVIYKAVKPGNAYAIKGSTKNVVIADTVKYKGKSYPITKIAKNAFRNTKVKRVTIGKNVTSIGSKAFAGCKKLKKVTFKGKKKVKFGKKSFTGIAKNTTFVCKTKQQKKGCKKKSIGYKKGMLVK